MEKTGRIFLAGICFLLFGVNLGYGQDYPSRPIDSIVGYPPGGVSDTTFRVICKAAEKHLGQPTIIINKPGMSAALSMDYLATQKPDGYTISYATAGALIFVPFFEKVTYKLGDFSYIMGFGYQLHALSVRAEAPWNSFREFLDYAKKNPGKIKYASYSPVSSTHIVMDLLAKEEGIDWTHIPYKGDTPAITALLGGHVDAVASASGQVPYARSGKLKFLAIFNTYPSKSFPHVPTLKSLGYQFPMVSDMTTSSGVVGPKGMRPETRKKLEEAFLQAAKDPSFIKIMESIDCPIVSRKGEEYRTELQTSLQVFEKLVPPIAAKMEK